MPRPKKQIFDPLIQAMIDRLPKPGDAFPRVERERWLALMKANMDLVYGSTGEEVSLSPAANFATAKAYAEAHSEDAPAPKKFKRNKTPDFYIDDEGICRNKKGDQILPKDVDGELVDFRGVDADIDKIVWADDSTGLQGDIIVTIA